jgi:hypothetical protein
VAFDYIIRVRAFDEADEMRFLSQFYGLRALAD